MKLQQPHLIVSMQTSDKKFHTIVCTELEVGVLDLYARGDMDLLEEKWERFKVLVDEHFKK